MQHCSRLHQCAPGLDVARDPSSHVPEAGTSGSGSPTDVGIHHSQQQLDPLLSGRECVLNLGKVIILGRSMNWQLSPPTETGPLLWEEDLSDCGVRHPLYQQKYGEMHQAYDLDRVLHINTCENRTGATGDVFGRRW